MEILRDGILEFAEKGGRMKHLGIFLGYSPGQMDPHQGISRLIVFIIQGALTSADTFVTVAAPAWLKDDFQDLLDDAGIPLSSIEFVTTRGEPYLSRIQRWVIRRSLPKATKRNRWVRQFNRASAAISLRLVDFLSTPSTAVFTAGLLLFVLAGLAIFAPLAILALLAVIAVGARRSTRRLMRSRYAAFAVRALNRVWRNILGAGAYERLRANEIGRLVNVLNRRKDIGVWYVPSVFWPEVGSLSGKIVIAAPDVVFYENPAQFNDRGSRRVMGRIAQSLRVADRIICYSEYVKHNHYVERNNIPYSRISVIPHGPVDLSKVDKGPRSKNEALVILHNYIERNRDSLPKYLDGFQFDDVEYIFYSSQVRPHKNIEGLIKVYESILRKQHRPVKLILTGRIEYSSRIMRLIKDNCLDRDVLSLHSVPNTVLSALYLLAKITVNPTQFEGGFPFTFTEGYSVGTPSIMSRIPAVTEMISDRELLDIMTFSPYDKDEMLKKILWGLDNTDALLEAQAPLYGRLKARPWEAVAQEYLNVMRDVEAEPARTRSPGKMPLQLKP